MHKKLKESGARVAADTKLVEAVNSGVSLSDDNVLQKNTTTIDTQGNVTTSKTDANEMILNKGKDNQITLNEKESRLGPTARWWIKTVSTLAATLTPASTNYKLRTANYNVKGTWHDSRTVIRFAACELRPAFSFSLYFSSF